MYKYRCRDCPVQDRCIEESGVPVGTKETLKNAFSARTDTMSTWAVLQKNCLLVKEDEEREQRAAEGSLLGRRLREARAATDKVESVNDEGSFEVAGEQVANTENEPERSSVIKSISKETEPQQGTDELSKSVTVNTKTSEHVKPSIPKKEVIGTQDLSAPDILGTQILGTQIFDTQQVSSQSTAAATGVFWLIVSSSRRRIALPDRGELILGRFDPSMSEPLDIDLTYEDQETLSVSRRHARLVGIDGQHTIEDLGSSNGLKISDVEINPGQAHPLQPGDRIALGQLELEYEPAPNEFYQTYAASAAEARHLFLITHVGVKLDVSPSKEILIGRADPEAKIWPTLDLSPHGDLGVVVSRRHAAITWRDNRPYVQDLESTFGTRLNGRRLKPNQIMALKPGDQLSLGGCVLAYEVEL